MAHYVGLDVSLEETSICVIDESGQKVWQGKSSSEPGMIAKKVRHHAPDAAKVGFETGPLSTWHWHELHELGLPVVCLDARHAKAALSMQVNKTDANDAHGLAQIVRTGWYRQVEVKSIDAHLVRSLLISRSKLVKDIYESHNLITVIASTPDATLSLCLSTRSCQASSTMPGWALSIGALIAKPKGLR